MIDTAALDRQLEFDRGMRYLPPVTQAMIAACSAVFVWQAASDGLESEESLLRSPALSTAKLGDGKVWRMVSSIFLHGGFNHLFGNMIALFTLGIACEHAFGSTAMLGIYLGGRHRGRARERCVGAGVDSRRLRGDLRADGLS